MESENTKRCNICSLCRPYRPSTNLATLRKGANLLIHKKNLPKVNQRREKRKEGKRTNQRRERGKRKPARKSKRVSVDGPRVLLIMKSKIWRRETRRKRRKDDKMIPNYRKSEKPLRDVSEITIDGCLSRLTETVIITSGETLIFSEISGAIRKTTQVCGWDICTASISWKILPSILLNFSWWWWWLVIVSHNLGVWLSIITL